MWATCVHNQDCNFHPGVAHGFNHTKYLDSGGPLCHAKPIIHKQRIQCVASPVGLSCGPLLQTHATRLRQKGKLLSNRLKFLDAP
jgi:hypothetical protein